MVGCIISGLGMSICCILVFFVFVFFLPFQARKYDAFELKNPREIFLMLLVSFFFCAFLFNNFV
jgi:uncharacterized membrane protein